MITSTLGGQCLESVTADIRQENLDVSAQSEALTCEAASQRWPSFSSCR